MRSQVPVDDGPAPQDTQPWRDPRRSPAQRADALVPVMTLEEKIAQLVGVWVGAEASGEGVAPHQADMIDGAPPWSTIIRHGLGQLTRPFGTAPVDPVVGAPLAGRRPGADRRGEPVRHPGARCTRSA